MKQTTPRITGPTLKVLREFLIRPTGGLSGAEIARSTGLPSGTLYPILFRLEKSGWLSSHWEEVIPSEVKRPRRRLYQITALGQSASRSAFREHLPSPSQLAWQS
jgi:PadR family transcriptional regulator, regulatory protein PadR